MHSFVSVILRVAVPGALPNIKFSPHVNSRLTFQLMKGIFNNRQNFLKCFNPIKTWKEVNLTTPLPPPK